MPGKTIKEISVSNLGPVSGQNVLDYWMNALQQDSIKWAMAVAQQALAATDQGRSEWSVTVVQWNKLIEQDQQMIRKIVEDARKEIPGGF